MEENLKIWNDAKRIVVKVGSSLVTNEGHGVDTEAIARWTAQIAKLQEMGKQVVWVSSGAVAEGMARLGWTKRPKKMHELQAAAAVGQMGIVEAYEKSFERYDIRTAQILLTHADLADRERYLNARQTLTTLLDLKVVPIINENDTVVTNEIKKEKPPGFCFLSGLTKFTGSLLLLTFFRLSAFGREDFFEIGRAHV